MLSQTKWRITAALTISCAGAMAWLGVEWKALRESLLFLAVYWGVFFVLFLISLFIVWLDIRYIKMQYAMGKRELFKQTLGCEEFRKTLIDRTKGPGKGSQN